MERDEAATYIYELFETACFELFQGLNCDITWATEEQFKSENAPVATIDAGSEQLELMLLNRMPFEVLALTFPVPDIIDIEEEKLEDWMAEMSNQLIGRLKSKLIKHDCFINIGLPESFFGIDVNQLSPDGYSRKSFYFNVDNEIIECSIYLDLISEVIHFNIKEDSDADVMEEGEIELF